jgi:hypothetical protein
MATASLRSLLAERQAAAVVLAQAGSTAGSRDGGPHSLDRPNSNNPGSRKMAAEANLSLFRQHAAVILARQAAETAVKRRIQREGRVKLSTIAHATLTRLEWLRQHPELLAEAVDRQRELLCECQVHNAPAPEETSGLEMKEGQQ